jgi:hypothetical protein
MDTLARARTQLLERAARISDVELRRTFLHAIGDHARTLKLALEWGLPETPAESS